MIWYNNVAHWPTNFDNSYYNFQIILYSSGEIKFNYDTMVGFVNSATIGMQNETGTSGLQMSFNSDYAHNNLTTYIMKSPSWVGIDELNNFEVSGEIIAGNSQSINIIAQNTGLPDGTYGAYLNISSNASSSSSYPIELVSLNNNIIGDINGDTLINVVDVVQLVNMALGEQTPNLSVGDINQDGIINVLDIVQIVSIILEG